MTPARFRDAFTGDLPGGIPAPLVAVGLVLAIAAFLDVGSLGKHIRAAGRGSRSASDVSHAVSITLAYMIAGVGYGWSGVFLAAEIGSSEPGISAPSLLEIYTALILGGSAPRIRQGSVLGAAFGALAIATLADLFMNLGLPTYLQPAAVGALLLIGLRCARGNESLRLPILPPAISPSSASLPVIMASISMAMAIFLGFGFAIFHIDPLLMLLVSLLAIALANGLVTGNIDLSVPGIIGVAALATAQLSQGSDAALAWVIPAILLGGGVVGLTNGLINERLRMPLMLISLAMAGVLNSVALFVNSSFFLGTTPFAIKNFLMNTATIGGVGLIALATPLLLCLLAYGSRPARKWLADLGGSPQKRSYPSYHWIYCASGVLAAAVGILLPGYSSAMSLSSPDPFILPALLAAQLAGLCIGRRGGNPLMMAFTLPTVLVLDITMVGMDVPAPLRTSLLGIVLLMSILIRSDSFRWWARQPVHL